jgi:para-aminobenzoate synthetase component 1
LYEALCEVASGEHFGYLQAPGFEVASVSPERFLRVDPDGHVSTRPIKGSMRRSDDPEEDRRLGERLLASEKDRAENIMIVDLMRNDLTQVCELGSVKATALCELESFAGIHHLVSTVEGALAPGFDALDALLASFPAGSITGAPKLRSIEYIANLEGSARGFYTGSLFYASSHGALDSSVLIRTAEILDGKARYGAGGAVVADSDPERERREALRKLAPLHRAIGVSPDE